MVARDEFCTFCRTTSAKGVPRIAKNTTPGFRCYWVTFTLLLFLTCVWQMAHLVQLYLSYPVSTLITEERRGNDDHAGYPAVTVCDAGASPPQTAGWGVPSYGEFLALVDKLQAPCGDTCDADETATLRKIKSRLASHTGYHQSLTAAQAPDLASTVGLIIDCSLRRLSDSYLDAQSPCDDVITVKPSVFSTHFTCQEVTLRPKEGAAEGLVGVDMLLYLDPNDGGTDGEYRPGEESGDGVRVLVRENGTGYTSHDGGWVEVPAGVSVTVQVAVAIRERLPAPYGDCVDVDEGGAGGMEADHARCMADIISTECNCTSATGLADVKVTGTPYCEDVNLGYEQLKTNYICMKRVMAEKADHCHRSLNTVRCKEYQYTTTVHTVPWPSARHLQGFAAYAKPILPSGSSLDGLNRTELERAVRGSFVQLRLRVDRAAVLVTRDVPAVTMAQLLSSFGGTLNLFSGISLFFFVEILEFLIRLCMGSRKQVRNGQQTAPAEPAAMATKSM